MMPLHDALEKIGRLAVAHDADRVEVVDDRCRFLSDDCWRFVVELAGQRYFFDIDAATLPRRTVH